MFVLVLYAFITRELYLVRDRIGIKQLYFSLQGGV
jgi:asparagine synthetase B (glutamine-hydrolysing)